MCSSCPGTSCRRGNVRAPWNCHAVACDAAAENAKKNVLPAFHEALQSQHSAFGFAVASCGFPVFCRAWGDLGVCARNEVNRGAFEEELLAELQRRTAASGASLQRSVSREVQPL